LIQNLIVNSERKIKVNKRIIHELVNHLKKELQFQIESLPINFVSLQTIIKINVEYLNHNFPTDIITFNYSGANDIIEGEIFISIDVAKENSLKYNCTLDNELMRLVIHGVLHLLGYDDMNGKDKKVMKKLENLLVEKFGNLLNNNFILKYDCKNC